MFHTTSALPEPLWYRSGPSAPLVVWNVNTVTYSVVVRQRGPERFGGSDAAEEGLQVSGGELGQVAVHRALPSLTKRPNPQPIDMSQKRLNATLTCGFAGGD